MRILLLSSYEALSHRYWRDGMLAQLPSYQWTVLALPPRYFRYRVRANPLTWFAKQQLVLQADYDLVIATSLVDIATLRGLVPSLANTPLWLYCHENQFAYPESTQPQHQRSHDLEAKMVFLYGCMAADKISFNSRWNRTTALDGLKHLLQSFPEKTDARLIDSIADKTDILPVPLMASQTAVGTPAPVSRPLRLLWNHRWEYDKGPELLLAFVQQLDQQGMACELNIVGQQFRQLPAAFAAIKQIVKQSHSVQLGAWGYIEAQDRYQQLMVDCDIVLSTALHDFQGIAVLEAVRAGCVPLLPQHLVYPEIFASAYLYPIALEDSVANRSTTAAAMCQRIAQWQCDGLPITPDIGDFSWQKQQLAYQNAIESLV